MINYKIKIFIYSLLLVYLGIFQIKSQIEINYDPLTSNKNLKFLYEETNHISKEFLSQVKKGVSGSPLDGLIPGIGYSTDTQSIGKAVCFETDRIIKSGQSSILKFDEALDYQSLLKTFNLELDIKGGYGIFSTNDMFKYFQSIEENSYSLSINYFQKVTDNMIMTYSYDPENILTTIGKNIYKNNQNPMFRLLCGDTLINSYEEGAILIISLKISFSSREEKEQFDSKIGISIGSFLDASITISKLSQEYNLNGKVTIIGFQLGGDPSQLSKLMSSSIVECDVKNTQACQETAKNLIDYISKVFPNQFKKDESGIWTSPLVPLTTFVKDYKLEDFGFEITKTYINQDIQDKRKNLIDFYFKNIYYFKNLDFLMKNYPINLSDVITKYIKVLNDNISLMTIGNSYGYKALDCFQFPFKCDESYNNLFADLDKDVDQQIDQLMSQFTYYSSFYTVLYSTKCLPPDWEWKINIDISMKVLPIGNDQYGLVLNSNALQFSLPSAANLSSFKFTSNEEIFNWDMFVNTEKVDEKGFKGNFRCVGKNFSLDQSYTINGDNLSNPYYFPPYKNTTIN